MSVTVILPDPMAEQLQRRAQLRRNSVQDIALEIIQDALDKDNLPSLEDVVAKIKTLQPNPANIQPAIGSLAEALRNSPHDPEFDLDAWESNWSSFEEELKAITIANEIQEGRR